MATRIEESLRVGELEARRVVVRSGDGRHTLTLEGEADAVGLYVDNGDDGGQAVVASYGDCLDVGIYDGRGCDRGYVVGLCYSGEGGAVVQMADADGETHQLTVEDLKVLLHGDKAEEPVERFAVGIDFPPSWPADLAEELKSRVYATVAGFMDEFADRIPGEVPEVGGPPDVLSIKRAAEDADDPPPAA